MAGLEGQKVGNYKLLRLLKEKTLDKLYLAEDIANENIVAVKLINWWGKEEFLHRAEWLTKFKHHNILPLLDYGVHSEYRYLVTQYIPHSTFRDRYHKGKILSAETIIPFVKQIASAIQYLFDNDFFNTFRELGYYTINPNNMLLSHNFEILLTGFEDVLFLKENVAYRIDDLPISYFYASPEQLTSKNAIASSQYSLACTIYEWLCGNTLFQGADVEQLWDQHRTVIPPSLHEKNPTIPPNVADVVMKALSKKPGDRYESIMTFADAFERAVMGESAKGIGEQFGKYLAVHLLGLRGIGNTYLGIGTSEPDVFKGLVAIKVFSRTAWAFNRELQLPHHTNILSILDYGTKDNSHFLVMDFARGGSILDRHPSGTILPPETISAYVKQIAGALQCAHDAQITNSSISPQNIYVGKNEEILLGGFEFQWMSWKPTPLMRRMPPPQRDVHVTSYGAPEFMRHKTNPASDQYSLAVVVYEWLCGVMPFESKSVDRRQQIAEIARQHTRVTPPSLREQNLSIPHEVETVVMKALSKDPAKRYETIQDFAEALEEAINSDTNKTDKYKMPDRSGEQFGQYRLVRLLGQGGFAEVYLGQHIKLETFAAIKVLHTRLSAKELGDFEKEAKVIASLKHPSIVRVFDYNAERNVPFLVMDHAPEGTMRQFHARGSRLSLPLVVKYVKQIADALQYAHNQKIIHRDVKPANMLIMSRDTVMLSDFGLAVIAHSERSWRVQDKAGTALYMAPEQFRGKAVLASDQYSLAVTAYEWLCGAPPFEEGDEIQLGYQHAHEPVPAMSKRGAVVSEEVEQVIMRALEKEPTKRFGSVKEFVEALEKAAQAG